MIIRPITLIFLLCYASSECKGYRILGIFPMAAPSHWFLGNTLMKGIAEAGHEVTMVSPFHEENPPINGKWTEIVLDGVREEFIESMKQFNITAMSELSPYISVFFMNHFFAKVTEITLNHTKVKNLLASEEKFDLVIVTEFMNDALKGFAKHFDAHLVLFFNHGAHSWFNYLVGNPSLPSYDPEILLHFPARMSFLQRLQNTLFRMVQTIYKHSVGHYTQTQYLQKYFPNQTSLDDVLYNVSLILLNSHLSLTSPRALVANMVEIGGFHIRPPKKLPEDLLKFMNDSKDGVIFFSLGSNFKSNVLLVDKLDALLKAFSKRKENILWKWENDVLPGQPKNVKIEKWLPQQDILAHPNLRAFITHGGFLSTTEAVHHGVPIISIPLGGDQKMNAISAQEAGYGLVVNMNEISEEKISWALEEIISNPKYKNIVKEKSRILRNRQVKPIDNAVYWIEYVIRHKGAKHLRVPYLHLAWYQYYLLDVFAFIFGVIFTIFFIFKKLFSYLCKRKSNIPSKKIKKN